MKPGCVMQINFTPPKCNDTSKWSVEAAVRGSLHVSTLNNSKNERQSEDLRTEADAEVQLQFLNWPLEAPKSAYFKGKQPDQLAVW